MVKFAIFKGELGLPQLSPVTIIPNKLLSFSDAMKPTWKDYNCWEHFFEDDCYIERFWNNPLRYLKKLRRFNGVLGLDYSVAWNFPTALKHYNHYRNSVCTYWLQHVCSYAIPQARCEENDYTNVLAGFPKRSVLAIGARSMVKNKQDRLVLKRSVQLIADYLEPSHIVWYGSTKFGVADYLIDRGIPITVFSGKGKGRLVNGSIEEIGVYGRACR